MEYNILYGVHHTVLRYMNDTVRVEVVVAVQWPREQFSEEHRSVLYVMLTTYL